MAFQSKLRACKHKIRVFIVSDISNEPDDAESLVRYMLYSNEFDTRGLVACTSCWMKRKVHPEDMETIIKAYGEVVNNLNAHVHPDNQYPPPEHFLERLKTGPALYGKEALAPHVPLSDGAKLLIEEVDVSEEPLWLLSWGGTNVLAQALHHIQQQRSASDAASFRSKLRVYTISDQDDTGLWIRATFPDIFYICSVHGWNQYSLSTWTGISGDILEPFDQGGPDLTKLSRKWMKENIQIGPLGQEYPDYKFIIEGDTPTFLYLIQNGLGHPEHPEWGSWGGRYGLVDLGQAAKHYSDVVDKVTGKDGRTYTSNKATIWRWRDEYQNSFAARMQWTLTADITKANHAPVVIVNQSTPGPEPLLLDVEAGAEIILDASQSYDADGDKLTFNWFQYKEPSTATGLIEVQVAPIEIQKLDSVGHKIKIKMPPPDKCAIELLSGEPLERGQVFHFILEVKDDGTPSLTTYKRIVLQATNPQLKGRRDKAVDTVTEWLEL